MSALKLLSDEHRVIVDLLGALHTYAMRLRSGRSVDATDLAGFAEVVRELVDYRHHEKEEAILLPLLARNGFVWSEGLLAELRREHGQLRHLIDVLCQAAAKDAHVDESGVGLAPPAPSPEERRRVAEAALAFVELERHHLQKEERALFPAIAQRLSAGALAQLGAELAQFDELGARNGGNAVVFRRAAELVQRYSIARDPGASDPENGDPENSGTIDLTGVAWAVAPVEPRSLRRVS